MDHTKLLERILTGTPVKIESAVVQLINQRFVVNGWSSFINLENISKRVAAEEFDSLKEGFARFSKSSSEISSFFKDKDPSIEFNLLYNDGGNASILLISEIQGKVNWYL